MQAIILAAGESSRLYPYNISGHKSLITLCGKTLISRTLESAREAGISNVIIIEGKGNPVSKSFSEEDLQGLDVKFIAQENPSGMGDALLLAQEFLEDKFFVINSYHFEFHKFTKDLQDALKKDSDIALLTKEEKDVSDFGTFTHENGKLIISEKKEGKNLERIVGIYLLTKKFTDVLSQEKKEHYSFEGALSSYSRDNEIVLVHTKKETLSIKYPWDLFGVKDYILERVLGHRSKTAQVSEKAVINGAVYIDDYATVMDGAVITGPAYIGKNSYIGTNAIVRGGSSIEERVVVGAHMEVKNSILMKHVTTHSGFIGDSIIGENTKIAAGLITANVRLDKSMIMVNVKGKKVSTNRKYFGALIGSNCSLGIKVGTMPGVIIGNKVIVGPSTTVMEDLEDDITYYTEFKKVITKHNT